MPRRSAERDLRLVVVTDRRRCRGDLVEACEAAVRGGATAVLLRDRDLAPAKRRALARRLRSITERYGATFLVHTDVALARSVGADGVHFSAADGFRPVRGLLVGVSCHAAEEVRRARADYAFLGPIFPSRSHPGRRGLGVGAIPEAGIPVVAIGGITPVRARGLARVAAIDSILGAADPSAAAAAFLARGAAPMPRERGLVAGIVAALGRPDLLLGPGDDAVVLRSGIAAATDLTVEGVHYVKGTAGAVVGRKATGRALSDLAAVGAEPIGVMIGVAVRDGARARAMVSGSPVPVLGGDTKETRGTEMVAVTALGRVDGNAPLPRSGGSAGDILFVTGPLGGSIHGRHLRPEPRIAEGLELRRRSLATACIDISDGLATDLHRLCNASGTGAVLESWRVPIHRDARRDRKKDPLRRALFDGEDYELLFAVPAEKAAGVERRGVAGRRVHRIGRLLPPGAGVVVQYAHGFERLPDEGWTHFRAR